MFTTKSFLAAGAAISLVSSSLAIYDAKSDSNVVVYWGSGSNQLRLSHYCDQPEIDVINLAFMDVFPQQGNGYPAVDYGNACWADPIYAGPGDDPAEDQLYVQCPTVQDDIPYCQANNKKILISLGGSTLPDGSATYQLTGAEAGIEFADFLWGAYGPYTDAWVAAGGIRPLDRGASNDVSCEHIDIDGFDFDIEFPSTDASVGYISMITRLRERFLENPSKEYLITGSPQCPDVIPGTGDMATMISGARFDALWIQFYNNEACSARTYVSDPDSNGFNYDAWVGFVNSGLSAGAKLRILNSAVSWSGKPLLQRTIRIRN
ncbi:hypothetical protein B7494_g7244 [Chlorociboria aeruginascens]|nr:hypothetical protein B7494_g7244 [Chlorociboria aeruginascens]